MNSFRLHRLFSLLILWSAAALAAAVPTPDKSGYTLANPVPVALLREMATDRPDVTESPFTIDAGHVQLEMDFVNFTRSRLDGVRTTELGMAPFNLRLGVLNNLEAGIFIAPYVRRTETPRGGPRETRSGAGDITLRGKFNFFGNDGGGMACGLIADLTLPSAARGLGSEKTEGALRLPLAFDLAGGWDGGAMTSVELHHRETGGYQTLWNNTVTISHALTKAVSFYCELTSSAGDGPHVAAFDVGLAWKLDANTQLDCGTNLGLSRQADDVLLFAGLSRRF